MKNLEALENLKIKFILLTLIIWLSMLQIKSYLDIPQDFYYTIPNLGIIVKKILIIIVELFREQLNLRNWYLYWIIFWQLIILKRSKERFVKNIISPTLLLIAVLFILNYIFAVVSVDTKYYVRSSSDRVMLQLSSFTFVLIIERLERTLPKKIKLFTND